MPNCDGQERESYKTTTTTITYTRRWSADSWLELRGKLETRRDPDSKTQQFSGQTLYAPEESGGYSAWQWQPWSECPPGCVVNILEEVEVDSYSTPPFVTVEFPAASRPTVVVKVRIETTVVWRRRYTCDDEPIISVAFQLPGEYADYAAAEKPLLAAVVGVLSVREFAPERPRERRPGKRAGGAKQGPPKKQGGPKKQVPRKG